MKGIKTLALLVMVAFLAFSCGDSGNPTNGGNGDGGSSKGSLSTHQGANTVVTESNVQAVSGIVTSKAYEVFGRAMATIKYAKPVAGTSYNLDGRVNGNNSGYAQVKGTMTINMSGQQPTSYSYNFICTYYDFSDDGALWLGGAITYTGTYDMSNTQNLKYNLTFEGGLTFNGTYEGTQDFTTNYTMTGQTFSWTSDTSTTSGGRTFTYTSKYPI